MMTTNIAARFLPPLAVIAAIALPAALLRPARTIVADEEATLVEHPQPAEQHRDHERVPRASVDMTPREREVEACFLEWDERSPGDTEMIARIDIDPNGVVLVTTHGGPDSPALRMCVEQAILRTQYPIGHTLSLDLHIQWIERQLGIAPNLIEPQRQVSHEEMQRKVEELKRERERIQRELDARRARHH